MLIIIRIIIIFTLLAIGLAILPFLKPQHSTPPNSTSIHGIKPGDFAPGQLQAHFLRYGYQFGTITEEDYLEDARSLLNESPGDNLLERIKPNGDIEHVRSSTHEVAIMDKKGQILAYFKEGLK